MLETTLTIAQKFSVSPFAIMDNDTDEVIMIINHYLEKAGNGTVKSETGKAASKEKRIRVNDETATNGWW